MVKTFETFTRHRTNDLDTSREAAEKIQPSLRLRQQVVLQAFRRNGPMTDEELFIYLRSRGHLWGQSTARTRRAELVELGFIDKTNEKRDTETGSPSWVWRAVEGVEL